MKMDFISNLDAHQTLADLEPGNRGVVIEVEQTDTVSRRLLDLGLLPNTPIKVLRRAPLGDPSVYELRGYRLCLRKTEAARVRVRVEAPKNRATP